MKIDKIELLNQLSAQASNNIQLAKDLLTEPVNRLTHSPNFHEWNILEVIEHLNTYNNYYLPKIKSAVTNGFRDSSNIYRSSILGNYFVKMMRPVDGIVAKKYKAAKQHLPKLVTDVSVIENYIASQHEILNYIKISDNISLTKNKIAISISPIIKLCLGDVYRFLLAHQQRHFVQIAALNRLSCDITVIS